MEDVTIRQSSRAKRMSLVVHWDGRCELVVPKKRPPSKVFVKKFLADHQDWIGVQRAKMNVRTAKISLAHQGIPKSRVVTDTKALAMRMIRFYSQQHPFVVQEVRVRNFKAQWGSCSSKQTLSFHYKLSLLPEHLMSYVVAHELSHTRHMNHSKTFWAAVEELCPEHKACRKELKQYIL